MVLDVLARLKASPLKNFFVVGVFFDQEELQLQGSKAFVGSSRREGAPREEQLPTLCLNFDIFAYGDTLWVYGPRKDSDLASAIRESAKALGFPLRESEDYPPSDHLPFLHAGVETAAVSLLAGDEIDPILAVLAGQEPATPPRVLQLIHTPRDTLAEVDPKAVARAVPVIERVIRSLDAKASR
jgi:aminopeptidase S